MNLDGKVDENSAQVRSGAGISTMTAATTTLEPGDVALMRRTVKRLKRSAHAVVRAYAEALEELCRAVEAQPELFDVICNELALTGEEP